MGRLIGNTTLKQGEKMKLKTVTTVVTLSSILALSGCGGGSSGSPSPSSSTDENITADLVVSTMIDENTGFMNAVDGTKASMTNENGKELSPNKGIFSHNGFIYTTGSLVDNKIAKYSIESGNKLKLIKEISVKDSGMSAPTSFIFVDNTKAYLPLANTGELLDINLEDFSIRNRIDLSAYALDANAELDGNDTNPEPTTGIIRDDKLYLALHQINFIGHVQGAFICRGKASILIIDTVSNDIEKHIMDDRTCSSGSVIPGSTLTLTEGGDIYVNNVASFGYDPRGFRPGYLRIKNGETDFDPDYFFNIGDLDLSTDFPDMNASLARTPYAFTDKYHNGKLYTIFMILGLTDPNNPNDSIGNKNFQPYTIDLENKITTKLDMLPTSGMSSGISIYKGDIVYPSSTVDGNGLYRVGEKTPFMTTQGLPRYVIEYEK